MARKRMIDPEFWLDEELAKLSPHARLLYIGIWGICDDNYATFPDRPEWIKAQVFPYESVSIPHLLTELEKNNKIIKFGVNDKKYWFIKNFFKYQRVEKPSKPKYPEYSRGGVGEESGRAPAEVKLSKEKGREDIYNIASPNERAGEIEKIVAEIDKSEPIRYSYQAYGLELWEKLGAPLNKKSEFIRIVRDYPEGIVQSSFSSALDYPVQAIKWKMFFKYLNERLKNEKP